jgi:GH3 auxin-responsive promoter
MRWLFRQVLLKAIALPIRRQLARFEDATHQPRLVQEQLLRRILRFHSQTDFGKQHHFSTIRTIADFQRQLPIAGYDYFEPYLARVRRGDLRALLADRRVHMFALTSGTTAARKYIPVTSQYLADYRRGWHLWGLRTYWDHPETKLRPILQLASDWDEYRTEADIPCGSVTGLTAKMQMRIVQRLYCLPPWGGRIKDAEAKYYLALRLSLHRDLGLIIAANPSTMVSLARTGDNQKESLVRDLHDGTLTSRINLPGEMRRALKHRLRRHPERAKELEEIISRTGHLYPCDYWPPYTVLGNWTGGSLAAYLSQYPEYFGDKVVRDVGLIASEGRMSIPFADGTPSGVLDITSHYFEFIPEAEIDGPNPVVLSSHEIEEGRNYYIVPTTAYGLYRYHISDVVRVTGFYNRTPLIEFLSKGSHFSNLTGEKLSEYHITKAMDYSLRQMKLTLGAYALAPCWHDEQPYYGLFMESCDLPTETIGKMLIGMLDRRLSELNIEYATKRRSCRLGAIRLEILPSGTWIAWDRNRLSSTGGTMEQYKRPCLFGETGFRKSMPVQKEIQPELHNDESFSPVHCSN